VRYHYAVTVERGTFQAKAWGNLDGDDKVSTFTIDGRTLQLTVVDELE
jgi:hypothetical protein